MERIAEEAVGPGLDAAPAIVVGARLGPVSYTHLRAHETVLDLVCRLLLAKKKQTHKKNKQQHQTVRITDDNIYKRRNHLEDVRSRDTT